MNATAMNCPACYVPLITAQRDGRLLAGHSFPSHVVQASFPDILSMGAGAMGPYLREWARDLHDPCGP